MELPKTPSDVQDAMRSVGVDITTDEGADFSYEEDLLGLISENEFVHIVYQACITRAGLMLNDARMDLERVKVRASNGIEELVEARVHGEFTISPNKKVLPTAIDKTIEHLTSMEALYGKYRIVKDSEKNVTILT